jgi:hypothetical protein
MKTDFRSLEFSFTRMGGGHVTISRLGTTRMTAKTYALTPERVTRLNVALWTLCMSREPLEMPLPGMVQLLLSGNGGMRVTINVPGVEVQDGD